MSNERSPREVCSTTIGISGLMRWAPSGGAGHRGSPGVQSFPAGAGFPAVSAFSAWPPAVVLGGPELLAGLGLLHRDGHGPPRRSGLHGLACRRRSWRSASQPPCSRRSCRRRSGARPVASASARTCSSISSSVTSMPSASATASTTSSRRTAISASGRSSSTICSMRAAGRGQVVLEGDALGELLGGLLEDRADPPVDHHLGHVDRGLSVTASITMRRKSSSTCALAAASRRALEVGAQLVERVELADLDGPGRRPAAGSSFCLHAP